MQISNKTIKMISKLKNIFKSPSNIVKSLAKDKLDDIILHNRNTLKLFDIWLSEKDWRESYYGYGVPENIYPLLNLDVGDEVIYTDLINYYSEHFNKVHYLELGVSVGKNFMQLAHFFKDATLIGLDIENINPVIEEKLSLTDTAIWDSKDWSLRKENSYLKTYDIGSNKVKYVAGDIWDETSWEKLNGNKFNIIFSDALHDPKALLWEYEMIKKYNLLADEFLFFWDDLNNGLEKSFEIIANDMVENGKIDKKFVNLIKINGWLGKNYPYKHDVGMISSFKL